jgi:AcrR family transcriptional regulator
MSIPPDRRSRKRLATRQTISDAATRLFMEHGFDHVTVDQIADAADVGRMTVFNHFPRKEDMFFDRDEEGRAVLRQALLERDAGLAPIEALRQLMHRLVAAGAPSIRFTAASQRFIATVEGSAALQARARAIRDELGHAIAQALAECVGQPVDDAARLAASMFVATLTVALIAAHRCYKEGQDAGAAGALFQALVDRGCSGVGAAVAGTPYA